MNKTHVLSAIFLSALATLCPAAPMEVPKGKQQAKVDKFGNSPLHLAVAKKTTKIADIETLLESGVEIDAKNDRGETAMFLAAQTGHPEAAKYLIFRGADVLTNDWAGDTPLHHASAEIAQILVEAGADVGQWNRSGRTPLHHACSPGNADPAKVEYLLDRGAGIDAADLKGYTPLLCAVDIDFDDDFPDESREVVRLLLARGADINAKANNTYVVHHILYHSPDLLPLCVEHGANLDVTDKHGRSLTHFAAKGTPEMLTYFIHHCGSIQARDHAGNTPLHIAAGVSLENVRLLLEAGADFHAKNDEGRTPVFNTVYYVNPKLDILEYLHRQGADLNVTDNDGETLLHRAAKCRDGAACVKYLLENGLDVNAKDAKNSTPLLMACIHNDEPEMIELLVAHGADVNAKGYRGQTPLHRAAGVHWLFTSENRRNVAFLLKHGADVHAVDDDGRTALFYAAGVSDDDSPMSLLLEAGMDLHARDNEGRTPIHFLVIGSYSGNGATKEDIQHLLVAGLDIDARDNEGNTPLHLAGWCEDAVEDLLDLGADPNIKNNAGELPIDMADEEESQRLLMKAMESGK